MDTILTVVTSLGLIIGSLAAAAMLCWLLWRMFLLIHHPDWAPIGIAILVALALTGHLPDSQLLALALAYAVAAAVPLWMEGRTWRKEYILEGFRQTS